MTIPATPEFGFGTQIRKFPYFDATVRWGAAVNSGLDISIFEANVSPMQLQGPKLGEVMKAVFGDEAVTSFRRI